MKMGAGSVKQVFFSENKRGCFGCRENFEMADDHFDRSGGNMRVYRVLGSFSNLALGVDHVLVAKGLRDGIGVLVAGINDDLNDTFDVSDMQKEHMAVI